MAQTSPPRMADTAAPVSSSDTPRPSRARRLARTAWLNLQVWIPQLLSPDLSRRLVKYWARESRDGTTWIIALPAACYRCGTRDGLNSIRLERRVRGFDSPLGLLYVSGAAALTTLVIGILFHWYGWYLATVFILLLGPALVWSRSWVDDVKLSISTCNEHAADLEFPELVLYERDLCLFAPSEQLAAAARKELDAQRRQGKQRLYDQPPTAAPADREPAPPRRDGPFAPRRELAAREPLPPIPLDDPDAPGPTH